ncbi:hypothetical protein [Mycolicibacterium sarraceniae]|uniref:Uncharacterized protein n=1 Tax=Mycolicibacterium sarraceniae TaxID=1534348 RepID=A0A7I7SLD6_9MYCO|nr:hypothetical protein [Mycolicibacterium sarraceniae]BBY57029.1 hypothetical protein MSAR_01650 [Mycolicibacterium sarraceniae]
MDAADRVGAPVMSRRDAGGDSDRCGGDRLDDRGVMPFERRAAGTADDVAEQVTTLRQLCREAGRDRAGLHRAVALRQPNPAGAGRLAQLGVDELVLVASPPDDPAHAGDWVAELAADWQ